MKRFLDDLSRAEIGNMKTPDIEKMLSIAREFTESVRQRFLTVEQSESLYKAMYLMQAELAERRE